jgi:phenylpropionate dioxygenase-like ring-hydroxylating dioxygenase large terminal subunit
MTVDVNSARDFSDLVRIDEGLIHSSIYTSEAIFELELARIFHRWWVYVGHESEVAQPGDYCLKWIGRQSVIMTRSEDGTIHLLMNRCRHRGATVCQADQGSSHFFKCQYHGWTYRNDGELIGLPHAAAFGASFDKGSYGLTRVPRVGEYRGFVFASLSPTGISLAEHLGHSTRFVDDFLAVSPQGRVRLSAGVQRTQFKGNWKLVGQDAYHPAVTHRSVQEISQRRAGTRSGSTTASSDLHKDLSKVYAQGSPSLSWDLGGGHGRLDNYPSKLPRTPALLEKIRSTEHGRIYLELLAEVHGEEHVGEVLNRSDPHMSIWPNLMITSSQVRNTRPLAAGLTVVDMWPTSLEGVPDEVNTERLRGHEAFFGAASLGSPDDYEVFERIHVGLQATVDPWVLMSRGLETEQRHPDGTIVGAITDEVSQRAQLRQWLKVMPQDPEVAL